MPRRKKTSRSSGPKRGARAPRGGSPDVSGTAPEVQTDADEDGDGQRDRPAGPSALDAYREKRSPERTSEPFGVAGASRPRIFVVQKHRARRLHWDLRLEIRGTLKSWAIPRGPSLDPAEKRMAVYVEDHPVEYADFEGLIPEGNYGAGAMIVWDRGTWVPLEDAEVGLEKGKLLFELHGYKLRGVWTLVRTKSSPKDWLLIKKPDAYATPEAPPREESILSGLTVEELAAGDTHADAVRKRIEAAGAPRRKVRSVDQLPMLAETAPAPFSKAGWLFELKYDGFRLLAARDDGSTRLLYRRGSDSTHAFPDLSRALAKLPFSSFLLDGEVVVLDDEARPSFQRLQRRVQLLRPADIERAAVELPATYYAFDLLGFEDYDLRGLPLETRKSILRSILPRLGPIRYSDHVETRGEDLFREVEKLGLEGVVAKRASSTYRTGRSSDWLKIRVDRTDDFAVVGYTESTKVGRVGFTALLLAAYDAPVSAREASGAAGEPQALPKRELVFRGRVGSGFSGEQLEKLAGHLEAKRRKDAPAVGPIPKEKGIVWVEPELVVEVRYKDITDEGILRQPVFLRVRPDKAVEDCVLSPCRGPTVSAESPPAREGSRRASGDAGEERRPEGDGPPEERSALDPASSTPAPTAPQGRSRVTFSNLEKIFWPKAGYSKGDLVDYYRRVSPWLLPYLSDRPVVLTRFPDGIDGKSFFQKDAPPFVPGWARLERMWSEHASREIDYFVADDLDTLLYLANMATIPLHVWSSRVRTLQHPDWCVIDLDPKEAPFTDVVKLALAVRALTEAIELPAFIKTSGATGLHILVPLGRQLSYEQSRTLGELISRVIVEEQPEIATIKRHVGSRGRRVYLDYLQNGHGRLLVAPLSVRPRPRATVSTPLFWSEVDERLDPSAFTIRTVVERLEKLGDPLRPVMDVRPDLMRALARLAERLKHKH